MPYPLKQLSIWYKGPRPQGVQICLQTYVSPPQFHNHDLLTSWFKLHCSAPAREAPLYDQNKKETSQALGLLEISGCC